MAAAPGGRRCVRRERDAELQRPDARRRDRPLRDLSTSVSCSARSPTGLAERFGTKGSPISLSTACASGATAIQLGVEAIRRGETDAALCIGTDGSVNAESLIRFSLLSALSIPNDPPQGASKPFSKNRDGFVMAEGAGALVLESLEHAQARGAKILGVIEGCGEMADSFHRTRSSPDGKPIIGCMRNALADAGLTPDDIDYINAHGTGTPENDKNGISRRRAVFGERAKSIPISSNKSMIGHTLSAAGAVEIGVQPDDARAPAHPADHQLQRARSGDPARRGAERRARRARHARALQLLRLRRTERLAGHGPGAGADGRRIAACSGHRRRARARLRDRAPARGRRSRRDLHVSLGGDRSRRAGEGADGSASGSRPSRRIRPISPTRRRSMR